MLQMTVPGQQHVTGEALTFYGSSGAVTGTFVVPSDIGDGQGQRTILLATAQAAAQGSFPAPDFTMNTGDKLELSGGAVCVTGSFPADCASWGSLPAATAHTLPNPQLFNAEPILGHALGRPITRGCATWLDPDDDADNSSSNFFDGVPPPVLPGVPPPFEPSPPPPRNHTTAPTEAPCQLDTAFNQVPAAPTNDTTPTFAFGEVPREYGVSFECRFGPGSSLPGGLAWAACPSSGNTFGPLADGTYTFQAYATGQAGSDPGPASWTFAVDTVPPQTSIDSTPPEPSNGFSATFTFRSSEPESKFQCQFESGQIQPCESGKTIFSLSDGLHIFRVWAIDQATNVDPTPAIASFSVDTTLGDRTAPDTSILSHPNNPASTGRASFTYRSNEPRSTFQCRLDEGPFGSCDAAGISYSRLPNGSHAFRVRATDRAGNVDSFPASYAWTVKAPLPGTRIVSAPPGFQRIKGGAKALKVSFAFRSSEPRSTFRCRIDSRDFKPCGSPEKLRATPGRHRFEVYAIDAVGNVEPVPARRIFRIGLPADRGGFFRVIGTGGGR